MLGWAVPEAMYGRNRLGNTWLSPTFDWMSIASPYAVMLPAY